MRRLPKGDGHPVLVLSGFVASDVSTRPLRGVLGDLGYAPYGWGLGRNLKFNDEREQAMRALVDRIYIAHGRKLSIVGWSLGGVFAPDLAKRLPEKSRSVISLGSPITRHRDYSNARRLYDAINGPPEQSRAEQLNRLGEAPPTPTTSVFSKTDGVVAWRGSLQAPDPATRQQRPSRSRRAISGSASIRWSFVSSPTGLRRPRAHGSPSA